MTTVINIKDEVMEHVKTPRTKTVQVNKKKDLSVK